MAAMAPPSRAKASSRNVKVGTYLHDPEDGVLYEVLGCRGRRIIKVGQHGIPVIGEVRIAKVSEDWPDSLEDEDQRGAWCPFEEVVGFEVVQPQA